MLRGPSHVYHIRSLDPLVGSIHEYFARFHWSSVADQFIVSTSQRWCRMEVPIRQKEAAGATLLGP